MPRDITLALAGHAPNRPSNVQTQLEDLLVLGTPDEDGYYDKPDRWGTITIYALLTDGTVPEGLEAALNIAGSIGDPDEGDVKLCIVTDDITGRVAKWAKVADTVEEADDPISHLVAALANSRKPVLLINWDDSDADDDELIRQAHATGKIRVEDFVMGRSQILPNDDGEEPQPEPEAEPEEEEEAPARRRTSRRRAQELEEPEEELEEELPAAPEPQEEPQAAATSSLEEELAAAHRQQDMQSTIAVGTIGVSSEALRDILDKVVRLTFFLQAQDTANAARQLADVEWAPLTCDAMAAEESLAQLLQQAEPYEAVVAATDRPAAKKAASKGRRKVVWDDDASEWKPAGRGRTRSGVRVGWMDADGNITEEP
ncbi:hypothetical protein [Streptomyces luteogriseus]|uniref:hypothetical protein n=1 Tax=Streptomyces luteogriseus TaxID=68233 RepID=UPI0037B7DBB9